MDNTLDDVVEALKVHENRSQNRYERLVGMVSGKTDEKEDSMSAREDLNIIGGGGDGGFGGGGMLGGLLIGALLGRNGGGLFGGGNGDGAGAIGLQSSIDTNTILQSLGDIKASVPLAEAQVQLALAGQAASITNQINGTTLSLANGQSQLGLSIANALSTAKDLAAAQTQTLSELVNNVGNQVDRNLYQLSTAVTNDGDKTRALIQSLDKQNDSRLITAQANEIIELRSERNRDTDRHGIEINMINNQNQNQMQFQQQAQVLNQLTSALIEVGQIARATNSTVMVGNTGTTAANQTANPTNVRA